MISRTGKVLAAAALVATTAAFPIPSVHAWEFREHRALGKIAYEQACKRLVSWYRRQSVQPPAQSCRLALACMTASDAAMGEACSHLDAPTDGAPTRGPDAYGDACALAGDHSSHPDDLTTDDGARLAVSDVHYLSLATQNEAHFHPRVVQEWARYHTRALELAQEAAGGTTWVVGLTRVLHASAFADHFLHDSFSGGHMGFNRAATSAGAAHGFHEHWKQTGREIATAATYAPGYLPYDDADAKSPTCGATVTTFGDGHLREPPDCGRQKLEDAAAMSLLQVLHAFVTGERDPRDDVAVAALLPSTAKVRWFHSHDKHGSGSDHEPLSVVRTPITTAATIDPVFTHVGGAEGGPDDRSAFLVELSARLHPSLTFRLYGGVGLLADGSAAVVSLGYVKPLFFTNNGVLTHSVAGGATSYGGADLDHLTPELRYRIDAEFGCPLRRVFCPLGLRIEAGPAMRLFEATGWSRFGYQVSLGLRVLTALSGGGRHPGPIF